MRKIFLEFIKQSDGDIDAAIQSFTRYFPKAEMESIFPGFSIEAVTSGSEQKKNLKYTHKVVEQDIIQVCWLRKNKIWLKKNL